MAGTHFAVNSYPAYGGGRNVVMSFAQPSSCITITLNEKEASELLKLLTALLAIPAEDLK